MVKNIVDYPKNCIIIEEGTLFHRRDHIAPHSTLSATTWLPRTLFPPARTPLFPRDSPPSHPLSRSLIYGDPHSHRSLYLQHPRRPSFQTQLDRGYFPLSSLRIVILPLHRGAPHHHSHQKSHAPLSPPLKRNLIPPAQSKNPRTP